MNYKTYADLSVDILEGIVKVPSFIQLVIGIPRSGMVPAYMVGAQLNLPVVSLDEYLSGNLGMVGERLLRVNKDAITEALIVDDSVYSGTAMTKTKAQLKEKGLDINYHFCAIYSSTEDIENVDFYFKYLPQPRVFQWNYKNHFSNTKACFDIDGVLCVDPSDAENDDGEAYRHFLLNAKPLFIPSYRIPCLITSRLEKYRKETEAWLLKHQVAYGELIMLDLPSAKERRALQIHAKFKAEVYKRRDENYFIESSWSQAKTIFELSSKPVFCTQNDVFIKTYTDIVFYENSVQYSDRHFKDIFSDTSEIGVKFQQLKKDYDTLELQEQMLKSKLLKLEKNKWVQFSKLNRFKKLSFVIKEICKF
jgi:uncharacterized HAD superfamily protein/hypoxanthine phosphoribosyltransferase